MEGAPQSIFVSGEETLKLSLTRRSDTDQSNQTAQFILQATCRLCNRAVQMQRDGCQARDGQIEMKFQRCESCASQTSNGQPGFIILVKQKEQVPAPELVQPDSQPLITIQTPVEAPA